MATDFTIADVLAWARTKPAGEPYCYNDENNCALCQFLRETGHEDKPVLDLDGNYGRQRRLLKIRFDRTVPLPINAAARDIPHTFGALVRRLEKLSPALVIPQSEWTHLDAYLSDIEQVLAS